MKILLKNIGLLGPVCSANEPLSGRAMLQDLMMRDAWLLLDDDRITSFDSGRDVPDHPDVVIDAAGGVVMPAFVDCHTHLVYATPREQEFVQKINGVSYAEIARKGGGILNSAARLAACSEDELFDRSMPRLEQVIRLGTGAIEIKSGYGLDTLQEIKMLRVARRLGKAAGIPVRTTFLGAHAVPAGMVKSDYVRKVIDEMIPAVSSERLADHIDVFCEEGFFTFDETVAILEAGKAAGMIPRVHANQLHNSGGVQAGVAVGARSVDHLEQIGDAEVKALSGSGTFPVLLPGAAFFLGLPYPPARRLLDAGLPLVVASDYNPGSCPSGNMMLAWSLACIGMRMDPLAALHALTVNPAHVLDIAGDYGSIAVGKKASIILTNPVPSLAYIPYHFGMPLIREVIIEGKPIMHQPK